MAERSREVRVEQHHQEGHILRLVIANEARRNAVTAAMLETIRDACRAVDPADVRCVVLTGAGERAFCAGYDLDALPETPAEAAAFRGADALRDAVEALEACPVPVIAALRGACFGAGGELAVACDLRVAADDLRFGMPPAKLGIVYSETGLARFVRTIGLPATKELFFTGDPVDAGHARELGLVNRVVSAAVLDESVDALAETVAGNAPLALQGLKRILNIAPDHLGGVFPDKARDVFARLRREAFESEDYREAMSAMADKRHPEFRGR